MFVLFIIMFIFVPNKNCRMQGSPRDYTSLPLMILKIFNITINAQTLLT